jgi:GH3 auxin-responsive promoter
MGLLNSSMRFLLHQRMRRIRLRHARPHETQRVLLQRFLLQSRDTQIGKLFDYQSIRSPEDFAQRVPIQDYDSLFPFIERMMHGERDILWRGKVAWFAKSSGTTSARSKFIPVTNEKLYGCHLRGCWDTTAMMYDQRPNSTYFDGKMLIMGGSFEHFEAFPATRFGDVSAIMLAHLPSVGRYIYAPSFEVALQANSEQKIETMARLLIKEDLRLLGGVPTWTVVLLRRVLELTRKKNIFEVWPNLQGYVHGGVSFAPYQAQFRQFIPKEDFLYWEIYNASEGFFAIQSEPNTKDMLLLLDNGVYYEFLPEDQWHVTMPQSVPLEAVEIGKHYALVVTTNAGLWRYTPGDTVVFTSKHPYKIRVSGRTNQFVNAFGEEVMVANTDKALAETCLATGALVSDYTVAPIFFNGKNGKGSHEWLIEFEREPHDIEFFNTLLDNNLQKINSDYEAKRFKSLAMERLHLRRIPRGTFHSWLKLKGKYGGQSKVPRLSNDRRYVEEILHLVGQ